MTNSSNKYKKRYKPRGKKNFSYGHSFSFGKSTTFEDYYIGSRRVEKAFYDIPYVYTAVDTISKYIINRRYYFKDRNENEIDNMMLPDEIHNVFIGKLDPNDVRPIPPFRELLRQIVSNREVTGNSLLVPMRTEYSMAMTKEKFDYFLALASSRWSLMTDNIEMLYGYHISYNGAYLEPTEVIHFKKMLLLNSFMGVSPVEAGSIQLSTHYKSSQMMNFYFKNMGKPSYILSYPGATMSQQQAVQDKLQNQYTGAGYGEPLVLRSLGDKNVHPQILELNANMQESCMEKLQEQGKTLILNMFGVPREILGEVSNTNKATIQTSERIFQANINSILTDIVSTFNMFIHKYYPDINLCVEKYPTSDFEMLDMQYKSDLITKDEYREAVGLPKVEDKTGDMYFSQINMPALDLSQDVEAMNSTKHFTMGHTKNTGDTANTEVELTPKDEEVDVDEFDRQMDVVRDDTKKDWQIAIFEATTRNRLRLQDEFIPKLSKIYDTYANELKSYLNDNLVYDDADGVIKQKGALNYFKKNLDPDTFMQFFFDAKRFLKFDTLLYDMHMQSVNASIDSMKATSLDAEKLDINPTEMSALVEKELELFADITKSITGNLRKDFTKLIRKAIDEGQHPHDLQKAVGEKFEYYKSYGAERIARTEIRAGLDAGNRVMFKKMGVTHLDVVGCNGVAGKEEPLGSGFCGAKNVPIGTHMWFHPNHAGCIVPTGRVALK